MLKFAGARQIDYYYLKEGFFSKKELSICHSCTIYLDKKYGGKKWYVFKNKILTGPIENDIIDIKKFREEIDRIIKKAREPRKFDGSVYEKALERRSPASPKKSRKPTEWQKEFRRKKAKELKAFKNKIKKLLKEKSIKMPASDIDAHLKHKNVDEIKELCEKMYHNGEISRTGNYRYFILTEQKKKTKSKKASEPNSEKVDVKAELKKYKEMLDDGLITQEQYDAKSNKLLGL